MFVNVSNALKNPGQSYPFEATVELPAMEFSGDPLEFRNISVKGTIVGSVDAVSVSAVCTADAHSRCCRCLEPVVLPINAEFDGDFVRTPDPEDPDQYELTGYQIELDQAVSDALLLEIPLRFLCKEDCKGLCPTCGVNRNLVSCTCHEGFEKPNPFSALKDLFNNEEV